LYDMVSYRCDPGSISGVGICSPSRTGGFPLTRTQTSVGANEHD